MLSKVLYLL